MIPQWILDLKYVAPWLAGAAVLIFLVWKFGPPIYAVLRKFSHFIDDVAGEPARPGVPARPGLMERMATMETKQDEQAAALEVVRHEVTTNHGSSLKDAVKKAEAAITAVQGKQSQHDDMFLEIRKQITGE